MSFIMNPQINTSRDGLVGHENPMSVGPLVERARAIYGRVRQNGNHTPIDAVWNEFQMRGTATDTLDAAMAVARECLDHFLKLGAAHNAAIEAERRAEAEHAAAVAGLNQTVQHRRDWAARNARPLWDFGTALRQVADDIEAAQGVPCVSIYTGSASAPIGNDAELSTFADAVEAKLQASLADAMAAIRAGIAARAANYNSIN